MNKKAAAIYLRKNRLYIDSESKTQAGFWVAHGAVHIVDANDAEGVSLALRSALSASLIGVPTPSAAKDLTASLCEAAGVKSYRTFVNGAKCVGAIWEDGKVTLTPDRKIDHAGNYVPIPEKARTVRFESDGLGQAVIDTFTDAE